ncbi:MAG: hypothetical protein ACR2QG_07280 [Gammaproteobacteria bacterium]
MEGLFTEYILSTWGLIVTSVLAVAFGAKSYDVYAKLWLAHTGSYKAAGTITYSEFMEQPAWTGSWFGKDLNEGLITYSYKVAGRLYTGKVQPDKLTQKIVDELYFKGAGVDVYYSPRLPSYSFTGEVPGKAKIAKKALLTWFVIPISILSIISMFVWSLFDLAAQ